MKNLQAILKEFKSLELQAHVSVDDILLKINQEVAELLKAMEENDTEEIKKESQDVLVNILSAWNHVGVLPKSDSNYLFESFPATKSDISDGAAAWNRNVGAFRKRYSRESISNDTFQVNLELFAALLLKLSGEATYSEVVRQASEKFRARVLEYLPKIDLQEYIADYPDFPKKWILFKDISPLLRSPEALQFASFELAKNCQNADVIAWLDARGFLFGIEVARILGKPFVMIRKAWKLPGEKESISYGLEYGKDTIEIQKESIRPWQKVSIIDDLLATGGTAEAAITLVEKCGAEIESLSFVISLDDEFLLSQPSRKRLLNYSPKSLVAYS